MQSNDKPEGPKIGKSNDIINIKKKISNPIVIKKKSMWSKVKDKYIYIVEKIKYFYLLDTVNEYKKILKNFIFSFISIIIAGNIILLALGFLGITFGLNNYLSAIALYFLIQEFPEYVKKFKGR